MKFNSIKLFPTNHLESNTSVGIKMIRFIPDKKENQDKIQWTTRMFRDTSSHLVIKTETVPLHKITRTKFNIAQCQWLKWRVKCRKLSWLKAWRSERHGSHASLWFMWFIIMSVGKRQVQWIISIQSIHLDQKMVETVGDVPTLRKTQWKMFSTYGYTYHFSCQSIDNFVFFRSNRIHNRRGEKIRQKKLLVCCSESPLSDRRVNTETASTFETFSRHKIQH